MGGLFAPEAFKNILTLYDSVVVYTEWDTVYNNMLKFSYICKYLMGHGVWSAHFSLSNLCIRSLLCFRNLLLFHLVQVIRLEYFLVVVVTY